MKATIPLRPKGLRRVKEKKKPLKGNVNPIPNREHFLLLKKLGCGGEAEMGFNSGNGDFGEKASCLPSGSIYITIYVNA